MSTSPLTGDATCDVRVIGAGIAGVLIAERLAEAGLQVIVLNSRQVGGGETAHTTATSLPRSTIATPSWSAFTVRTAHGWPPRAIAQGLNRKSH
jgi:glycine/D-amino acid oxidase-like deaminating enzyme